MNILVTGARASMGKEVLVGLLRSGQEVRAPSRDPQPGEFPAEIDVIQADLEKPELLPRLLDGVKKVFLYTNAQAPKGFAAAARAAGVEHIVLLSSHSVLFPYRRRSRSP